MVRCVCSFRVSNGEQCLMISVIIPTLNAADSLPRTLVSLLVANQAGVIREVIVSDGGSADSTCVIAEEAGARVIRGQKGRGLQLQRGAAAARGEWLLFLHADTALSMDWHKEAERFIERAYDRRAAVFSLRFNAKGIRPWLVALGANLRAHILRLPYGDQGLLISRRHYDRLRGYKNYPLFEDVDLVRRIVQLGGRGALAVLPALAVTSAARYQSDGYFDRVWRNARCLRLYFSGVRPEEILEIYHGRPSSPASGLDGEAAPRRASEDPPLG